MQLLQVNKLVLLFLLIIKITPIYADSIIGNELIEKFNYYNGKEIVFQGEAIGDKLERKTGVWINICDTTGVAMGVWFNPEQAEKINTLGNYDFKGDIVQIKGIFNKACKLHIGDMDIHATSCDVIQQGYNTKHTISKNRIIVFISLSIIAIILIILWRYVFKPKLNNI